MADAHHSDAGMWAMALYLMISIYFYLSLENGVHGDAGEEMASTGEYIDIEEPLNGLVDEDLSAKGAGRLSSLAESDLLQPSDGEREGGMEGELDIMEVLEDQPFEVLDSAACGDLNQDHTQLGTCVCTCMLQCMVSACGMLLTCV